MFFVHYVVLFRVLSMDFVDWRIWWPGYYFWRWCLERGWCGCHDENRKWSNCVLSYSFSYNFIILYYVFCRRLMHGEPLMSSLTMQVYMKEKPWFFLIFYLVPYCHWHGYILFRNHSGHLVDSHEEVPMGWSDWFESHWSVSLYPGLCSCASCWNFDTQNLWDCNSYLLSP